MKRQNIFWLVMVAGLSWPLASQAASLYFSPSSGTYTIRKPFTVGVKLNTNGIAVNAAEAVVAFPTETLQLGTVSRSSSIFSLWATNPSGSNATGRVIFSGGRPSPGFTGSAGTILTMSFTAKKTGPAKLSLSNGKALANDGQGTNVLTGLGGASFAIGTAPVAPPAEPEEPARPTPQISSSTHPDENQWFKADQAQFAFSKPPGLIGVSYEFTNTANTAPDDVPEAVGDTISVPVPEDGVWYFHLRGQYANGWSATDHYTVRRDRTPPEPFEIKLERDRGENDPSPAITFTATDTTSGVVRYAAIHNGQDLGDVSSPATLEIVKGGAQDVTVTAVDAAGNERVATLTFGASGYPAPSITGITDELILLDRLSLQGTALAGDTVVLYVDGDEIARLAVGNGETSVDGVTVRLPWSHTDDQVFGPGKHQVTAVAISPDERISAPTDPRRFNVSATAITFGGRVIATWAAAPIAMLILLLMVAANAAIIIRLSMIIRRMHRRDAMVDAELHELQHQLLRSKVTMREVESAIEKIEGDLEQSSRSRRPKSGKRRA